MGLRSWGSPRGPTLGPGRQPRRVRVFRPGVTVYGVSCGPGFRYRCLLCKSQRDMPREPGILRSRRGEWGRDAGRPFGCRFCGPAAPMAFVRAVEEMERPLCTVCKRRVAEPGASGGWKQRCTACRRSSAARTPNVVVADGASEQSPRRVGDAKEAGPPRGADEGIRRSVSDEELTAMGFRLVERGRREVED